MIELCKKEKVLLFVNHQRHFDPILLKWSRKIRNGLLGDIFQVNAYYYNGLFNAATHLIDLLYLFLGTPKSVIAKYNKKTSSNKLDLNVDGLIYFENDVTVSLQSLNKNYGCFGFSIFGDRGWLNITNLGFEVQLRKKVRNRYFKGYYELSEKVIKEGKPRSMIASSVSTVIQTLDKKIKPLGTGEDGLKVLKLLLALRKSSNNKGKEYSINL
jgi:predicted dehydrogenase